MIRNRKRGTPYRKVYLTALVVSLVFLLLPESWTGKFISLAQIIVPFQHAATVAADSVSQAFKADGAPVSGEAYRTLERQKAALEHQVAALATRVTELEGEVEILAATRLWDVGDRRIDTTGRLIPARVITEDLLSWRASRLINAGKLQGVRRGLPVASHLFTIDQGKSAGVRSGMAILLREVLVGFAQQVGTHTTRVKLLCDVSVQMKVRIGRFTDEGFVPLDPYFWLTGRGNGVMQIRDVSRREVEAGRIRIGDIVLSDPMNDMLPAAMTIGKITAIDPDRNNPLLTILTVNSAVDEASLQRVYVFDPATDTVAPAFSRSAPVGDMDTSRR